MFEFTGIGPRAVEPATEEELMAQAEKVERDAAARAAKLVSETKSERETKLNNILAPKSLSQMAEQKGTGQVARAQAGLEVITGQSNRVKAGAAAMTPRVSIGAGVGEAGKLFTAPVPRAEDPMSGVTSPGMIQRNLGVTPKQAEQFSEMLAAVAMRAAVLGAQAAGDPEMIRQVMEANTPEAFRDLWWGGGPSPAGAALRTGPGGVAMWDRERGTGDEDEGLDWSTVALGYKIDPNGDDTDAVRIYAGEIDRVAVAQTDVTVADGDYVYVRRTLADDTMLVTNGASVPANTSTYRYYRLYKFSVSSGAASISNIYRAFDIEGTLDAAGASGSQYQVLQIDADGNVAVDWLRAG